MKEMRLHEIVKSIVGPIKAIGDSGEDRRRLENAEEMTELVECLLRDIYDASKDKDRIESSMKTIGKHCHRYLQATRDWSEE